MINAESCPKCQCGIKVSNNAKLPEYYSFVYCKPDNYHPSIEFFISACDCWHGNFVKNYYRFPKIKIYSYHVSEEKEIIIKFSEFGEEYSLMNILQNWIKYKQIG